MSFDIETLATSLGKASKNGQGWVCQCPVHQDHTPSLSIGLGDTQELLLYCHAGCSFESLVQHLKAHNLLPLPQRKTTSSQDLGKPSHTPYNAYIRKLWHQALPLDGTPAHHYLKSRLGRLLQDIPPTLRYLPNAPHSLTKKTYPCLLAAVTPYPDKTVTALHRTFLRPDGLAKADLENPKMMLGKVRGGAVRLGAVGKALIIAEGIETALTVQGVMRLPAWAALSSQNMKNLILPPLPKAQKVYIAQDNDPAGEKAAVALADRVWAEGRTAYILQPDRHYNDFNDVFLARRFS